MDLSMILGLVCLDLAGSHRRDTSTLRLTNPASRNGFEMKPRTHFAGNGHIGSSRIPNVDYEKFQSQQAPKRTHTLTVIPPPYPLRPDSGTSASHFRGDYTSPAAGNKGSVGDSYVGPRDGIGMGRVINGARILPPSVMHGAAASTSHFNGLSEPMHRNGIGEDRNSQNDERLVYQAALQVLSISQLLTCEIAILFLLLWF